MDNPRLAAELYELLPSQTWVTAGDLKKKLPQYEKTDINRGLYALQRDGKAISVQGTPPVWKRQTSDHHMQVAPEVKLHCIVDLGNTHDCLKHLEDYAARNLLSVAAYADLAFQGYGVNPRPRVANLEVFHADTPDKNSADLQIIWDVCRQVQSWETKEPSQRYHIIVATKDLGFQRLKHLVERNPFHKLTFVTNWEGMRMHIE